MDVRGYLVRVSDGVTDRHTVLLAPDIEFARQKAMSSFAGTRWRVSAVAEIPK
ncbi:MAG: hypothetical protein WBD95_05530 [Xanthobacteraceae bacterium]